MIHSSTKNMATTTGENSCDLAIACLLPYLALGTNTQQKLQWSRGRKNQGLVVQRTRVSVQLKKGCYSRERAESPPWIFHLDFTVLFCSPAPVLLVSRHQSPSPVTSTLLGTFVCKRTREDRYGIVDSVDKCRHGMVRLSSLTRTTMTPKSQIANRDLSLDICFSLLLTAPNSQSLVNTPIPPTCNSQSP